MPKQKQKQSQKVVVNITTSKPRTRARKSRPKTTVKAFEPRTIYNPPLSLHQTQPQSILQQHPDISKLHALVQSLVRQPSVIVPKTEIKVDTQVENLGVPHTVSVAEQRLKHFKAKPAEPNPVEPKRVEHEEPAEPNPVEPKRVEHEEPAILSPFRREPTPLEKPFEEQTFETPQPRARTKPPELPHFGEDLPTPTRIKKHFNLALANPQDFREFLTDLPNEELKSEAKTYNVKTSIQVQTEEINMRGRNIGKPKLKTIGDRTKNAKNRADMIDEIVEARELEGY